MGTVTYATECLWCGRELDDRGICFNEDCDALPEGDSLHSHLDKRRICGDPWCPDNHGYLDLKMQRACSYCFFTADYEGICDDDDCPTHLTGFNPPSPEGVNSAPGVDPNHIGPGHWMVTDGLVDEHGALTHIGRQCRSWIAQRIDTLVPPIEKQPETAPAAPYA